MFSKHIICLISFFVLSSILAAGVLLGQNKKPAADEAFKKFVSYRQTDLDSALYYAEVALNLGYESQDSMMVVRAERAVGWIYQKKGDFEQAIKHYSISLQVAKNNGFEDRVIYALNSLGIIHYENGEYDQALVYHLESLGLRERQGNKLDVAISANNIGLIYYQIRNYVLAADYLTRSVSLYREAKPGSELPALVNLALCMTSLNRHDQALQYYEEALDLCENECGENIAFESYRGIGLSHYANGDQKLAREYFLKALKIAREYDLKIRITSVLYNLARLDVDMGKMDSALVKVWEGQEIASKHNYKHWSSKNYGLLARIYALEEDFELAYKYQTINDSLKNLIINEDVIIRMASSQANYQERENLETIQSQDEEISRRTTLLALFAIIIVLITVILVILYRVNKLRKKINRQLSDANAIIETKNKELNDINSVLEEKVKERTKELKETNEALLQSNIDLDNFIYKTSHDIRGPLATLQGMCNVALIDIDDAQSLDYFQKIGMTANRLNVILSKLLIINQINNSLITLHEIDIRKVVKDILKEYKKELVAKYIKVENKIEEVPAFKSDDALVKIILNNLISNASKFYNSSDRIESWIKIEATRLNGRVELKVIDNGIGIDDKVAGKIFDIFSKASEVSDSAGLGLYLVRLAVEKLRGTINHSKTREGHTQFTVGLPMG
ncbi:tetratricopeptide repeat protein [Fulvivirga sp. M361]|uniref:tetratricopeptide repeat protein n=1 Tax=Fulvivirga sp. M361 TaxID=2594266 RepID=UPI00117BA7BD|nr:tetratricopeptide repeat protein [Fulvivirga sp. M361]TRX49208.1 tetratricopeptide repeat protein [Fulvivirga sp. M361]